MNPARTVRRATNSAIMLALRLGLPVPPYSRGNAVIIETRGRRSGKPHHNPAGCIQTDGRLIVVAEHGVQADWVRNALANNGHLRVYHRGKWQAAQLRLLEGDPETYLRQMNKRHADFVRRLATMPRAVEISLE